MDYASTPVEIRTTGHTYETTAGKIGLSVDEPATVMAALDVGRSESVALRPLNWVASFFHRREAPLRFKVRRDVLGLVLISLEGTDGRQPIEPSIRASGDAVGIAGGKSGFALDAKDVTRRLLEAAEDGRRPLTVRTEPVEQPPTYNDAVAQQLADEMTEKTAKPLLVLAGRARGRGRRRRPCGAGWLRARHRRAPGHRRRGEGRRRPRRLPHRARAAGAGRLDHPRSRRAGRSPPSQTGIRCCDADAARRGARRHQRGRVDGAGEGDQQGARRSRRRRPLRWASRSRSARPSSGRACSR